METGYTQVQPDYNSRPISHFVEHASFLIQRFAGLQIYFMHLKEIYAVQDTGISVHAYVNQVLDKYR